MYIYNSQKQKTSYTKTIIRLFLPRRRPAKHSLFKERVRNVQKDVGPKKRRSYKAGEETRKNRLVPSFLLFHRYMRLKHRNFGRTHFLNGP